MARKSMIKKQNLLVIIFIAILVSALAVFVKPESVKNEVSIDHTTVSVNKEKTFTELSMEKVTQNSDGTYTYNGEYFSTTYPENWYKWFFGTGVSLDVFQVNSFSQDQVNDSYAEGSFIAINVETNDYRPVSTLEGKIDSIKEMNNGLNDDQKIIYKVGQFKSVPALYSEKKSDSHGSNNASYINTIWLIKNNIVYEIKWIVTAKNMNNLENIISRDQPVYNQIINSFEFK